MNPLRMRPTAFILAFFVEIREGSESAMLGVHPKHHSSPALQKLTKIAEISAKLIQIYLAFVGVLVFVDASNLKLSF